MYFFFFFAVSLLRQIFISSSHKADLAVLNLLSGQKKAGSCSANRWACAKSVHIPAAVGEAWRDVATGPVVPLCATM